MKYFYKDKPIPRIIILLILFILVNFLSVRAFPVAARESRSEEFQNTPIVFAVIGDYGLAGQDEADVANLVKSWNPDFIVTTGDNNQNGRTYEMDDNIGQYYHEYIFNYKGKYGTGSPTRRFFPSIGNHDWSGNGVNSHLEYFSLREHQRYYDFVQGPVHFFMLDSDRNEPDGVASNSEQATWLRKALAASTSTFNVVVLHHPPYSSGKHGSTEYIQWPFSEWGADVILSGHDHVYERLIADDIPHFINGLGGAEIYGFETPIPESRVRFNLDHGAMRVEAHSAFMKFQFFTIAGLLIDEYSITSGIPIATSITRINPNPTNLGSVDYQVTFSEPVTGVDVNDFILASPEPHDALISGVSGSASTYIVTVATGSGNGTLRLDLIDNDSILNLTSIPLGGVGAGNGNFESRQVYDIDKTAPNILSITCGNPIPSNSQNVEFQATFSEPVVGVDASDFIAYTEHPNEVSISGVVGSGSLYTVTLFTGLIEDDLRLDLIDDDTISDAAGNTIGRTGPGNGNYNAGDICPIDTIAPTVLSIKRMDPDPVSETLLRYLIDFSEPVTGVDLPDFSLITTKSGGAILNQVSGTESTYTVTVDTGRIEDLLRLDLIDDDSISDRLGNPLGGAGAENGSFRSGETYTVIKPSTIVSSIEPLGENPTKSNNVEFRVTFTEDVTGVDLSDFTLGTVGISEPLVTNVSGWGPAYNVSVSTGAGDGSLRLDLVDDNTIVNESGNPLGGAGVGDGNFSSGGYFSIDRIAPRVTSIIRASPNPSKATSVDFIVTFSEKVAGVDILDFTLESSTILNPSVTKIQNMDPFYIVTVTTGLGSGNMRLDLIDNDSITDIAGNPAGGEGLANGFFNTGEEFTIAKDTVNYPPPSIPYSQRNVLTNNRHPTISWNVVRGASAYEAFIANDENFSQIALVKTNGGLSYSADPALPDGKYFWRVRAYNSELLPGRFSKVQIVMIDTTPPTPPTLYNPPDGSVAGKRPALSWEAVSSAISYHIEIDDQSDFSSPIVNSSKRTTNFRESGISSGIYYWRIQAKDRAGNWSDWSRISSFIVP